MTRSESVQNERQNISQNFLIKLIKTSQYKSISTFNILFGNLATGHFSRKIFLYGISSGHTGSNYTCLMSV